jgi:hypothetical protein
MRGRLKQRSECWVKLEWADGPIGILGIQHGGERIEFANRCESIGARGSWRIVVQACFEQLLVENC